MKLVIHKWIAGLSIALVAGMTTAAIPGEYVYRPTPASTAKAREFVENQ